MHILRAIRIFEDSKNKVKIKYKISYFVQDKSPNPNFNGLFYFFQIIYNDFYLKFKRRQIKATYNLS